MARESLAVVARAVVAASLSLDMPGAPTNVVDVETRRLVAAIDTMREALVLARSEPAGCRPLASELDGALLPPSQPGADRDTEEGAQVARGFSESLDHVVIIATSAEELSNSSAEIATCAAEAARVSHDAVAVVGEASDRIAALRVNGTKAARVTSTIHNLAERTRILALNTTIEATNARSSTRVMGVIAEQIRTLAEDAAKGTEQIAQTLDSSALHIEQVQAAIERVAHIAAEVLHYQGAIATAAEQQAAVVADIAQRAHVAQHVALAATAHVGPAL